jgi:hypothetical protein
MPGPFHHFFAKHIFLPLCLLLVPSHFTGGSGLGLKEVFLSPGKEQIRGTSVVHGYVIGQSASPSPVADAAITVYNELYGYSALTNSVGWYEIENIEAGTYTVCCLAEGYHPDTVFNMYISEDQTVDLNFDLLRIILPPSGITASFIDDEHSKVMIIWQPPDSCTVDYYMVYRFLCSDDTIPVNWLLLEGYCEDNSFFDEGWKDLDNGCYGYAIVSVAGSNYSHPGLSNELRRSFSVHIYVHITGYDDPDIYIVLEGPDPAHTYQRITKKNHLETFYDIQSGFYNLYIDASGYAPQILQGITIYQEITFTCCIGYPFYPPQNVQVIWPDFDIFWSSPVYDYQPVFNEGFESGTIPVSWNQEFIQDSIYWSVHNGSPSGDPGFAFKGAYNASLSSENGITILSTPALDLSKAVKPKLNFWFAQTSDTNGVHDWLAIYYRTNPGEEWNQLFPNYQFGETNSWDAGAAQLPEPSGQYSIGFLGDLTSSGGMGICMDEISVLSSYNDPETDPVIGYNVYIDGHFSDYYPQAGRYPLDDLTPGFHIAGVQAVYTTGESMIMEDPFYFTPCNYVNPPENFYGTVQGSDIVLHWDEPSGLTEPTGGKKVLVKIIPKSGSEVRYYLDGYRIWYFDEILAFVPDSVNEFTDTPVFDCDSTQQIRHRYTITAVYSQGESCKIDPPFEVDGQWDFPMPGTVTATKTGSDSVLITWLPAQSEDISGYTIYRNRQFLALTADTFYCEPIVNRGRWNYEVTALMEDGTESCFAGPALFTYKINGLKGTVKDVATLQPLEGAAILLSPGGYMAFSDNEGDYSLNDIPPGNYSGMVSLPGYYERDFTVMTGSAGFSTRNICLADSSLSVLPFRESWDSSSFVLQHWSFDTVQGLWDIHTGEGNPAPCASFGGDHPLSNYNCRLVSNRIDISEKTGNIFLNFDLKLDLTNPSGAEILDIEVLEGEDWIMCDRFYNLSDTGWVTCHYDLSDIVKSSMTQIRFTVQGTNAADIEYWMLDNILLETGVKGTLSGYVTDFAGEPLPEIAVNVGDLQVVTDQDGFYTLEVLAGDHPVSITAEHFNPYGDTVYVYGSLNYTIILMQPFLQPQPTYIYVESWGGVETWEIELINTGSGPAAWNACIHYPEEIGEIPDLRTTIRNAFSASSNMQDISESYTQISSNQDREPWDVLFNYDISTIANGIDNQTGIAFSGSMFYVSLWNDSRILTYSAQGEFMDSFEITGANNIRNLSWDGYFLYGGSAAPMIYKIDPVTFSVTEIITSPVFVRGITYDPHNDAFWVCDWETDLYLVGREGQTLAVIPNPGVAGVYGLAYDNLTGPASLWLFCQGEPGATFVQLDIATGQLTGQVHDVLAELNPPGFPVAAGAFLSANVVPGVVTLGGIVQAENNILFGYELQPSSWLSLSSYTGQLDAGESQTLVVQFDGEGLNWDELYEATIHFTSDPDVPVEEVQVGYMLLTGLGDPAAGTPIAIYPNPANDLLVIECLEQVHRIDLYDNRGRLAKSILLNQSGRVVVDTQGLPLGLYYIKVHLGFGRIVVKKTIIR